MTHLLGTLTAANAGDRLLSYLLLPFGEPGRTNQGTVTAAAGAVTLPAGPVPVNLEHDKTRPVGRMTVTEAADGLYAELAVARTRAGDDLLEEAAEGLRAGISVELAGPVIRAGALLAGALTGAGCVVTPAFPSALLLAADCGDPEPLTATTTPNPEGLTVDPAATPNPPAPNAALDTLLAALAAGNPDPAPAGPDTSLHGITTAMSAFGHGQLTAGALDVITKADVFDKVNVPQYVGELKGRRRYTPRYMPLLDSQELTSSTITGWRYVDGKAPAVADWSQTATGIKPNEVLPDIPTNEVETELVTATASYLAGGHQIGRIHYDLPTPGFLESYIRESDDDFLRKLDAKVFGNITTAANHTAVTAAGADAAGVWSKLILGAHHVLENDLPEWALIGPDLWRAALNTTKLEALELLSSALGLEDGQLDKFRLIGAPVTATALNGAVIVGSKAAATLHTLPGGPTRVEAINVQKGTVDNGVFGYWGIINHSNKAMVKVS